MSATGIQNGFLSAPIMLTACLSLTMTLIFAECPAQSPETTDWGASRRPCKQEDLIGHTYKMVFFKETPPRAESMMLPQFPYQYLTFKNSSNYAAMATNIEITMPAKLSQALAPFTNGLMQYTISDGGILQLLLAGKLAYNYRCLLITRNEGEYIKGDLLFTAYTRRAKSVLLKLYRRWY